MNNNKPEFHHCSTYSSLAKIEEGVHKNGSVIIKVLLLIVDALFNRTINLNNDCNLGGSNG